MSKIGFSSFLCSDKKIPDSINIGNALKEYLAALISQLEEYVSKKKETKYIKYMGRSFLYIP